MGKKKRVRSVEPPKRVERVAFREISAPADTLAYEGSEDVSLDLNYTVDGEVQSVEITVGKSSKTVLVQNFTDVLKLIVNQ